MLSKCWAKNHPLCRVDISIACGPEFIIFHSLARRPRTERDDDGKDFELRGGEC